MKIRFVMLTLIMLILAVPAFAQDKTDGTETKNEPKAALKLAIDKVIAILKDPKYAEDEKLDEQREELMVVITDIFDFDRIGQLSLGRFRKKLDDAQTKRFSSLFQDLLVDTYLKQVQKEFRDEEVAYVEQLFHPSDKERAQVKTQIIRKDTKIPVDYSLYVKNGRWRVYDIRVEGVSLVKNYRTQFEKILLNQSPDVLIGKLEKKAIDADLEDE